MRTVLLLLYSILHLSVIKASAPLSCKVGDAAPVDTACAAADKACSLAISWQADGTIHQLHACIPTDPQSETCTTDTATRTVTCLCKQSNCNLFDTIISVPAQKATLSTELELINAQIDTNNKIVKKEPLKCKVGDPPADTQCDATGKGCSLEITLKPDGSVKEDTSCVSMLVTTESCNADTGSRSVTCVCKTDLCNVLGTIISVPTRKTELEAKLGEVNMKLDATGKVVQAQASTPGTVKCLQGTRLYTEPAPPGAISKAETPPALAAIDCAAAQICETRVKSSAADKVEAKFACIADRSTPVTAPSCSHDSATNEIVCVCNADGCNDEATAMKAKVDGELSKIHVERVGADLKNMKKRKCKKSDAAGALTDEDCYGACEYTVVADPTAKTVSQTSTCSTKPAAALACTPDAATNKVECLCDTDNCNELTAMKTQQVFTTAIDAIKVEVDTAGVLKIKSASTATTAKPAITTAKPVIASTEPEEEDDYDDEIDDGAASYGLALALALTALAV